MDSTLKPPQTLSPNLGPSLGDRRNKNFQPLSSHGLPKASAPSSPGGSISSHRFSKLRSPPRSPNPGSMPMSPKTPPLSARSFSTFIDSEPSTPAYSPRPGHGWDNSTLMLLSPVRSSVSTTPSSPPEPKWEMIQPSDNIQSQEGSISKPKGPGKRISLPKPKKNLKKKISTGTSLSSHPVNPIIEEPQKENVAPADEKKEGENEENKTETEDAQAENGSLTAPLEKLATKMKTMLRRKSASMSEKKAERKRRNLEGLERMETTHWTEY